MIGNLADEKSSMSGGAWLWRRITVPFVLALLVLGFVGGMRTATGEIMAFRMLLLTCQMVD